MKTWYGLLKIIDGLTKCIKVLTSKSTWWGAETIHLKCYTNTWLHYYGHFSIFVKLIRHKQRCVTTKGEAPDAMNLPCLTYALVISRLHLSTFIFFFFSFWKLIKFQNMGSNYDSFYATQRVHFVKWKRSRGKSIHKSFTNPNQIFKDSVFLMSQPYWIQVWPSKKNWPFLVVFR